MATAAMAMCQQVDSCSRVSAAASSRSSVSIMIWIHTKRIKLVWEPCPPGRLDRRAGRAMLNPNVAALGGDRDAPGRRVVDGHADHRAILGPTAVVVAHVGIAQQFLEHEPGVARPLTNPAVGDDRLLPKDAFTGVELAQLVRALERAVLVGGLGPRDVLGSWNMAAALGRFRETRRGYDLAVELGWRTHVDQCSAVAATLHQPAHVPKVGAQTRVRLARLVVGGLDAWRIGQQRPPFELPLLAAAIHQGGMLVAVDFADPVRECGEPVVVVAIKYDPRGVGDSALAHQLFEGGAGWNVAADRIAELGGPVEADRPLDVASLVSGGVHVDLQESDLGVLEMVVDPLGGYERRRVGVVGWHAHHVLSFPCCDSHHATSAVVASHPWKPSERYVFRPAGRDVAVVRTTDDNDPASQLVHPSTGAAVQTVAEVGPLQRFATHRRDRETR